MSDSRSLGDPAFEPTDDDLVGLARRAFAHIPEAQEAMRRKLRSDIAAARQAAMERLRQRKANTPGAP